MGCRVDVGVSNARSLQSVAWVACRWGFVVCGLTGFVDFEADRLGDGAEFALKPMVETLACRGPDAQASWIEGPAALGHTRLAILDLAGGGQPMVHQENGEPVAVLVFTGEIYNYRELRAELSARGHRFRTRSDSEVVLAGFLAWGADLVPRLEGMFAFAVWEVAPRRLTLVRDRLGIKPLFYRYASGRLWFGSELKAVLAHPEVTAAADLDSLRELVLASHPMVNTPGRSVFAGIGEVPPGHLVAVTPGGPAVRRYWSLVPREHTDDLATTVGTVRSLLERTVRGHLQGEVSLCTLLSGGLDSSVIATLAAPLRAGDDVQHTVSVDFGGGQESADDIMRRSWDAPFVELMAGRLGSDHRRLLITPPELADPRHRAAVVDARDGLGLGDFDASLLLMFRAVRERHTIALSGDGADEIFGGYRWFGSESTGFPWHDVVGRAELSRLLAPDLAAALDLEGHRAELYRQAAAELDHLPGTSAGERELRLNSYLNLTRFLPGLLDRTDRLSMSCGLEVRVPFCDHRLVEYVFNTPWPLKTFDGREKSLLRAASAGLVPQEILQRRKSPYPMVRDPRYRAALSDQLRQLLAGDSPVLPLLDVAAVRALLLDADVERRFPREGLEFVLDLDLWLRVHRPRLLLSF
jgi:asparagine synthase (glutamine-hydrolysing)